MASIVYNGPARAVNITIPGGAIRAERGKPTEVPDDLAERLLAQDTFTAAAKAGPAKEKP